MYVLCIDFFLMSYSKKVKELHVFEVEFSEGP